MELHVGCVVHRPPNKPTVVPNLFGGGKKCNGGGERGTTERYGEDIEVEGYDDSGYQIHLSLCKLDGGHVYHTPVLVIWRQTSNSGRDDAKRGLVTCGSQGSKKPIPNS